MGKLSISKVEAPKVEEKLEDTILYVVDFDLDKLAYSVAMHETKNCTLDYWSALQNNCFWIGKFQNWKRVWFKYYNSPEDSYDDFKRIRTSYYWWLPDINKAIKYSWNDRAEEWLNNVMFYYNKKD